MRNWYNYDPYSLNCVCEFRQQHTWELRKVSIQYVSIQIIISFDYDEVWDDKLLQVKKYFKTS